MTLLIDLSEMLEGKVRAEAKKCQRSPEQVVVDIVTSAFEDDFIPSVAEVVDRIKAIPPNPAMVTPPQGSWAEVLRNGPTDPDFDLEAWNQEWATAEEEFTRNNLTGEIVTRRQIAMTLLRSWTMEKDDEKSGETDACLRRSLDEDRLSDRQLFPPELQGITW